MSRFQEASVGLLLALSIGADRAYPQPTIVTVAGTTWTFPKGTLSALSAPLGEITGLALDAAGNLYVADQDNNMVMRVTRDGALTVVAGDGTCGFRGDGGPATSAWLCTPMDLAVDSLGNLYIADSRNERVRVVTPLGVIRTIAGNGREGYSGDGGPAADATLNYPIGVAVDAAGIVYIAENFGHRIRKVTLQGTISTFAGNGAEGFSGDGGPAANASLSQPSGVAADAAGNVYIADTNNYRIRKVTPAGIIGTVAGNEREGFSGDGGPATGASLIRPIHVALDPGGNVYIADGTNCRIRRVSSAGIITTVAGNGQHAFAGDGGPAIRASLNSPAGIVVDAAGNLYIADGLNRRVRQVTPAGIITTVAGNGEPGFSGDGGPATSAYLNSPRGVALDLTGNLYIADTYNHRIRKVTPAGIISTVAGSGVEGFAGDGKAATSAALDRPAGVVADPGGNIYIADTGNRRVRKVTPAGIVTTLAGNGDFSFGGDGGLGTSASLGDPVGLALDALNNLYIADAFHGRVRKVTPAGLISTAAGGGQRGLGDGGPAVQASLDTPSAVAVDRAGNLYIADSWSNRVRKVTTAGIISTVAGNGREDSSGDGGPATSASLNRPSGVAVDALGNLYIAEGCRIRQVTPDGIIHTLAGSDTCTLGGDGGPAASAFLNSPKGLAVDPSGNLYLADSGSDRIRKVSAQTAAAGPTLTAVVNAASYQAGIAPSTWISITGTALSASTRSWTGADFAGGTLPLQLDGVRVMVNGKPAYPAYISPQQINALVGSDDTVGPVAVQVITPQGRSDPLTALMGKFSPGLFAFPVEDGRYVVAHTPDGTYIGKPGLVAGLQTRPVRPGEVVTIYGTGFGPGNPALPVENPAAQPVPLAAAVTIRVGGVIAGVGYAGLIGSGLYQFNFTVPQVSGGDQALVVAVGGSSSQSGASITVQQ